MEYIVLGKEDWRDEYCSNCIHENDGDCPILRKLEKDKKHDLVTEEGCMMSAYRGSEITQDYFDFTKWLDQARTEEVAEVLDKILASYHYTVIEGMK